MVHKPLTSTGSTLGGVGLVSISCICWSNLWWSLFLLDISNYIVQFSVFCLLFFFFGLGFYTKFWARHTGHVFSQDLPVVHVGPTSDQDIDNMVKKVWMDGRDSLSWQSKGTTSNGTSYSTYNWFLGTLPRSWPLYLWILGGFCWSGFLKYMFIMFVFQTQKMAPDPS